MKHAIIFIASLTLATVAFAKGGSGSHSVRGHTTKNGSYVQPHHATNRDSTKSNNYSHRGNMNPYTGKKGAKH